jgi:hypothetical protein
MATIQAQDPVNLSQNWGVSFSDYTVNGKSVDFQDLMIVISEKRAVTVEGEVTPLTTRINQRNKDLDDLGDLLAGLTAQQATYDSEATGGTKSGHALTDKQRATSGRLLGWGIDYSDRYLWKSYTEMFLQKTKSKIDSLNNQAQTDMTRLQSLVDRRDESYSTASNLMSAISDSRSNLIRNL